MHQERSLYRNIFVTKSGDEICMLFRYPVPLGRESCKLMSDPNKLIFDYTQMMMAGLYLNPKPAKLLIIGEGGGSIPTALQEMFPDMQIDLVEIDAAVDRVAKRFFDFKPGPKMRVFIEDGRVFVKRIRAQNPQYNMIMLDAFDADYIPEHLLTREFLQEVKSILAPDGVLVANTFSNSALYDYESVTYRAVFGPFYNLKLGNRIIIGRNNGIPPMDEVRRNAAARGGAVPAPRHRLQLPAAAVQHRHRLEPQHPGTDRPVFAVQSVERAPPRALDVALSFLPCYGGGAAIAAEGEFQWKKTRPTPIIRRPGHNRERPVVWERWQKKRTFVRALEGTYSHLTKELLEQPRVLSRSATSPGRAGPSITARPASRRAPCQGRPIDRDPHRSLWPRRLRPEARPSQQRRLLRHQGPRLRHP